jgi:hypothetical protein
MTYHKLKQPETPLVEDSRRLQMALTVDRGLLTAFCGPATIYRGQFLSVVLKKILTCFFVSGKLYL